MPSTKTTELRKLSQRFAYSSLQLHEAIARKAGFSGTDHKYLGFFLQKGILTAGELSDLTGLTTGAVTGLIDRFEKKGLVKRDFDKNDRRKVIIVPDTKKIAQLLEPFYKEFQDNTDRLIAAFSADEQNVIELFLRQSLALVDETKNNFL